MPIEQSILVSIISPVYNRETLLFPLDKINVIPNGIDSKQFIRLDKIFCRDLLNLPSDKKIILFVSDNTNNNRKGLSYLLRAIEKTKTVDFAA